MKKVIVPFALIVLLSVLTAEQASGIPSFSRKYKTSCATCHYAFPKLNAFGESVRRNGYQFPEGTDPQFIKEEEVSLGSEGYKRVWPDAIWPNAIPGSSPIAIMLEGEIMYEPRGEQRWNFDPLQGEIEVMAGGTLGEDLSFMGELEVGGDEIEIERMFVVFSNVLGPYSAFNVKVGKFEPNVLSVSNFRRLAPRYWITTLTLGDNAWSLESTQRGIEASGILGNGRLGYNAGIVEGRRNLANSEKDLYGHLTYKFGGLRLDGVSEGEGSPLEATKPWEDNSVTVGAFVYNGTATLESKTIGTLTYPGYKNTFQMFGGDVSAYYGRANVTFAYAIQQDKKPFVDRPTVESNATHWFAEGSYLIYPWLLPVARYESFTLKGTEAETRVVGALNILVRANVKLMIETEFEKEHEGFELHEVAFAIMLGF
jgi:hypothetical protein